MNWAVLIPIIAQEGIPVAEALFKKWSSGNPPTQADFAELRELGKQTAIDRVKARLVANGIPLDDPKAVQLLSLLN